MWQWIVENSSTIIISFLIAAGLIAVAFKLYRDKKRGNTCCGNCADCTLCHSDGSASNVSCDCNPKE